MGCSSVSDAHIYMHHVSSVRDWWKKNELGCSWDVQDAQDALKTDPKKPHHILTLQFSKVVKDHAKYVENVVNCQSI